jgi:uncharacterized protein YndB with AHSA1/START domain
MSKSEITIQPGTHEIVMTRTFDAPRDLVFKTITDPTLIPQWWGPSYLTTTVDEMEVRPGGKWRFEQKAPDGTVHGFHGVYHSVDAPERFVCTFEYEGVPGHVLLQTTTLEDAGGKTRMIDHSVFQSVADRDGMVAAGMESGALEMMDRLAELLAAAARV